MIALTTKDKVVATLALALLGATGGFCGALSVSARRAQARVYAQAELAPRPSPGAGADSLVALVAGGAALALSRRILTRQ